MERRLIDGNALRNGIREAAMESDVTVRDVLTTIDLFPAIDAVEVVRCRECKHWGFGFGFETDHAKMCGFAHFFVGANGYCVYGERREPDGK